MRIALGLLAVIGANAQSEATSLAMQQAISACTQALSAQFQGNTQCAQQSAGLGAAMTGVDSTALDTFCASPCFATLNTAYAQFGTCMLTYRSSLVASLTTDGVDNPTTVADTMLRPYGQTNAAFKLMCTKNERGDYCMPLFSRMSTDLSLAVNRTDPLNAVCTAYFNTGCCLTALDDLYAAYYQGASFLTNFALICPSLADFNPPKCLSYGQTATALTVTIQLTGLDCAAYDAQSETFKAQYEAALKMDLAAHGVAANFIIIKSISSVNGACTLSLVIRAGTDAATNALQTAASTLNTAPLTTSNQVLTTAPAVGTVSAMSSASVTPTTVSGQPVGANSAAGLVPSALLVAVAAWVVV